MRELAARVDRILVLEEGQPCVERLLRGLLPPPLDDPRQARRRACPLDGELTPDIVRRALGLGDPERRDASRASPCPPRPPQLCQGCPHRDAFAALNAVARGLSTTSVVTSDIGCYTLGALPPYQAIESCVCMGASVGMAKGAADAGLRPALAVIGDSTFLHSGVTPLMDAVADDTPMTLLILDNETVGMTGPAADRAVVLAPRARGPGPRASIPRHLHVVELHPRKDAEVADVLRREIEHDGLSVVIGVRECIQSARKRKASS